MEGGPRPVVDGGPWPVVDGGRPGCDDRPVAVTTGLIVGRFCPPHLGHSHLIEHARVNVDQLVVFVNTRDGEVVPGELRAAWLAELHPEVTVVRVQHDLDTDFTSAELWERWIALFRAHWPLPSGPDVVFSSELYGGGIAERLGARHEVVDVTRSAVPVSATMIRADPAAHLHRLAPVVRAWVEAHWVHATP